ncbi:uncharacterized LOC128125816 homolog [Alligator mississippiensis]|uniref:uncharacterized LOC128125816 homolog n=1 Tax=Alligator mississippiensis TaxID=8496 RepID=UPI0028777B71|nr:uncharacterized LOC128125816 homolog [Alligator mississippiensis]
MHRTAGVIQKQTNAYLPHSYQQTSASGTLALPHQTPFHPWAACKCNLTPPARRISRSEGIKIHHKPLRSQTLKGEHRGTAAEENKLSAVDSTISPETGRRRWGSRGHRRHASRPAGTMQEPFAVHFLKVLKELLAFVLFSYTVLIGALLLAGWTTYFLVLK